MSLSRGAITLWPFKPKIEKRESYTSMLMQLRYAEHQGIAGVADLTATVQSCVTLWEGALSLADVYTDAPLGSQIVPRPEDPSGKDEDLAQSFRGRVLLPESVNVGAARGAAPSSDWRPASLTPNLEKSGINATHEAAKNAILAAYGVLPALVQPTTMGPLVREAQRHLSHWVLTPIARLIAEEASEKLGTTVTLDVESPLHAFDAGGRARALNAVIAALAAAKAAGVDPKTAADFAGVEI